MARHKQSEREEIRRETRQALLDSAAVEIARHGYDNANVNTISQSAGFAKGTVYNYFPGKEALLTALIEETASLHRTFILERIQTEKGVHERLVAFFRAGFDFVTQYLPRAQAVINILYGPHQHFKETLYEAYQPIFAFVGQEIIAPGIQSGVFRPVSPGYTTTLLMTLYLGTCSQVDERGKPMLDPEVVADFAWNALKQEYAVRR